MTGSKLWYCDCGWEYKSPIPLTHPPIHACKPGTRKRKTLKPKTNPTNEQEQ